MQGFAVPRDVQSGAVSLADSAPYAMIAVRGADRAPTVQVRDPSGKLVLDDTGAPVQGLSAGPPAPKPVNLATQDPEQPTPLLKKAPQGILHVDGNVYHDANIDFRNTTIVLIRAPKKGRYTITAKPGSAPITEIRHANALATPQITATRRQEGQQAGAVGEVVGRGRVDGDDQRAGQDPQSAAHHARDRQGGIGDGDDRTHQPPRVVHARARPGRQAQSRRGHLAQRHSRTSAWSSAATSRRRRPRPARCAA